MAVENREIPPTETHLQTFQDCMHYDPETGKVTWTQNPPNVFRDLIGKEVGTLMNSGYRRMNMQQGGTRRSYAVHRIAWFLHYNEWPEQECDHINHNRSDNRISNLRLVSIGLNNRNCKLRKDNKSGYRGVVRYTATGDYRGKWAARVHHQHKLWHLGIFDDPAEASAVVEAFYQELDGDDYVPP